MPIAGLTRLRKHQFGRQQDFGSAVPATRAYPFRGVPNVELNWTDPDIDVGAIGNVAAPTRTAPDLTAPLTSPVLNYNDLPLLLSAVFGGQVAPTGGGTAKTWSHEGVVVAPLNEIDPFDYEFGDDVTTDWFQFTDGVIETLEISGPDGLGPLTASHSWRFGSVASTGSTDSPVDGTVPTPGLDVDPAAAIVYLKDIGIYIADSVAGLGAGQVIDALHNFTLRITAEYDQKRWANGSQTFAINAYGRASLAVELEATYSKTADIVGTGSEADDWLSDESVSRYIEVKALSTVVAETPSTFYSWDIRMPARYYTRTDSEIGGNSTVVLTARAFYDPDDFDGFFTSELVNTLTEGELGIAGS